MRPQPPPLFRLILLEEVPRHIDHVAMVMIMMMIMMAKDVPSASAVPLDLPWDRGVRVPGGLFTISHTSP